MTPSLRQFIEKQKALLELNDNSNYFTESDDPTMVYIANVMKSFPATIQALGRCVEALEKIAKGYDEGCFNFQAIADYDIKIARAALQMPELGESEA